ncbi:hypothetical protein M5K25_015551 [Dendrobium thyrsiflorum]|uniref:Uncharacterized protein n=1 Tax=Dendrobium thyrsiflorum TaxID=117978 RepID=A0ABD0UQK8_DENTH
MKFKKISFCFLLLLIIFHGAGQIKIEGEAKKISFAKQEKYGKVLQSLGLMCRCCDLDGGDCRSSWDSPCYKLDCQPWRHF